MEINLWSPQAIIFFLSLYREFQKLMDIYPTLKNYPDRESKVHLSLILIRQILFFQIVWYCATICYICPIFSWGLAQILVIATAIYTTANIIILLHFLSFFKFYY